MFLSILMQQVKGNREKWVEPDRLHTGQDFMLIAQEQLGQLSKAALLGDLPGIHREIFHTTAMLYELFCLLTPGED